MMTATRIIMLHKQLFPSFIRIVFMASQLKQFFTFTDIGGVRTNGHCMLCDMHFKDKRGIFSNFAKNLKRKHLAEYNRLFNGD